MRQHDDLLVHRLELFHNPEKTKLIDEMNALSATNEKQKSKLNSLHYLVGERKGLEKKGVIVIPVFAKDRSGAKWSDDLFDHDLDLRSTDEVKIICISGRRGCSWRWSTTGTCSMRAPSSG